MRSMLLSKTPASLSSEVSCRAGCAAGQEFADRRQAMKPRAFARQMWRKRVGVEPKLSTPNSRRTMTLQLPPSSNWSQLESTLAQRGRATIKKPYGFEALEAHLPRPLHGPFFA